MTIDHICFVVRDIKEAVIHWESIFEYKQYTKEIINKRQKVSVVFLKKEGSIDIKLIEPLENNASLNNFIKSGKSLHHVCFKCDNIIDSITYLQKKGLKVLVPPEPGEAFGCHDIAFLWSKFISNIELVDTSEKAGIINKS